jgi:cold shock protein
MQTGTVKFFREDKGFGFITDDVTGQYIFVHISAIRSASIRQDDRVLFEITDSKKG